MKEIEIYQKNRGIAIKEAAWNSLSKESRAAYQSDFNLFFSFIKKNPKQVVPNDILEYVNHLQKEGYKNSSINRKVASLSKMFRIMKIAGEIKDNPVETLKEFKKISMTVNREVKIPITIKDVKRAVKIRVNDTLPIRKMALIVKFLSTTGLRISEFINIKNGDIQDYDRGNKIVRIVGKGKKERSIFIGNELLAEIRAAYPEIKECKHLFYTIRKTPYDRRALYAQIKSFFWSRIKKRVHPHMLRHTYITHKISVEKRDIKAVSRFVGHADVSTTLNMYVDKTLDVKESKIKI